MDNKGKKFEKMSEMMRNCCKDGGGMADCHSMMKKMMGQKKRGGEKEKVGPSKEE